MIMSNWPPGLNRSRLMRDVGIAMTPGIVRVWIKVGLRHSGLSVEFYPFEGSLPKFIVDELIA